jgi:hypothetical protein
VREKKTRESLERRMEAPRTRDCGSTLDKDDRYRKHPQKSVKENGCKRRRRKSVDAANRGEWSELG